MDAKNENSIDKNEVNYQRKLDNKENSPRKKK